MSNEPPPLPRAYSNEELAAIRYVHFDAWREIYRPNRGPAWFATGGYWPKRLRQLAARWERLAKAARIAAAAMAREGCRDDEPLTAPRPAPTEARQSAGGGERHG